MISMMLEADFGGKQVCGRTGHRNLKSLENYHVPSARMKMRQTSVILGSLEPNRCGVLQLPNRKSEVVEDVMAIPEVRDGGRGSVLPIRNSQVSQDVVPKREEGCIARGLKRKAETPLEEMIVNQQQLFNQQNSIMSDLFTQLKEKSAYKHVSIYEE